MKRREEDKKRKWLEYNRKEESRTGKKRVEEIRREAKIELRGRTGLRSLSVVLLASTVIALKTFGANIMVQSRSHTNVPNIVLTTSTTTLYLEAQ